MRLSAAKELPTGKKGKDKQDEKVLAWEEACDFNVYFTSPDSKRQQVRVSKRFCYWYSKNVERPNHSTCQYDIV